VFFDSARDDKDEKVARRSSLAVGRQSLVDGVLKTTNGDRPAANDEGRLKKPG